MTEYAEVITSVGLGMLSELSAEAPFKKLIGKITLAIDKVTHVYQIRRDSNKTETMICLSAKKYGNHAMEMALVLFITYLATGEKSDLVKVKQRYDLMI